MKFKYFILFIILVCLQSFSEVKFKFYLRKSGITSAGIYNEEGNLVKTLWTIKQLDKGWIDVSWDEKDEFDKDVSPGIYTFKIVVNNSKYENVGIIGNTGKPPDELQHIQSGVVTVDVDEEGNIYTANDWEEAGHDFKVFNPDGKTIYHARFQMRNLNPYNSLTDAITVDENYIYCAGWMGWEEGQKGHVVITRFKKGTGEYIPFSDPEIKKNGGFILLYKWDKREFPDGLSQYERRLYTVIVLGLTVIDDTLYVTDAFSNKIHIFNKETGVKKGEFNVKMPVCIKYDKEKRLWIGHEHNKVSIFTKNGDFISTPINDLKEVKGISFGPDGKLYIADGGDCKIKIYKVDGDKVQYINSFGEKAKTGDFQPDKFYTLGGVAVDKDNNIIVIGGFPTGGARITKFSSDGKCMWDHFAFIFCNIGKYPYWKPDELITTNFHKVILKDKENGEWTYGGLVLDYEKSKYKGWHTGVPKFVKLGNNEFLYIGCRIFRKIGDYYRLVSMVGGPKMYQDGSFSRNKREFGLWTWTDTDMDGEMDEEEIRWFKKSGESFLLTEVYGIHSDSKGNLIFGDSAFTKSIWELPLSEIDKNGNPVYDWAKAKIIVPEDKSGLKFLPKMAIRSDDGSIYSIGTSKLWNPPDKGPQWIWMGGWILCKYDKNGERVWAVKLPQTCTGMDLIPENKGVMVGFFEKGHVYHFTPDGLLIGIFKLGEKAGNITGWLDNQSCVGVERDKRDKKLDVFVEDSYLNRFIWYRVDDSDITTYEKTIEKK